MADPGSLTLHYDFANDHSLAARIGPTLSITRTTTATYFDSAGILKTAAAGEARTFDHNPSTGASLGLLVEEARTNLCLHSEDFSNAVWTEANGGSTFNQTTAPDGTTTADRLADSGAIVTKVIPGGAAILTGFAPVVVQEGISDHPLGTLTLAGHVPKINITTAAPGTGAVSFTQAIAVDNATAHVMSFFFEKDQLDWGLIEITGNGAETIHAYFDLVNGVVGADTGADNTSEFIEDVGSDQFRCGIVFTSADTSINVVCRVANDNGDATVDLDGTSSIFVWGAQPEAGAFPTSYIKTTTVAVTRNADDISTTDVSWYNGPAGTIYFAGSLPNGPLAAVADYISISKSDTDDDRLLLQRKSNETARYQVRSGASTVADLSSSANLWGDTSTHRVSVTYSDGDFEQYTDGSRTGTGDQAGAIPVVGNIDRLFVGTSRSGSTYWNGHIAEIRFYDERLPNSILESMSNGIFPSGTKGKGKTQRRRQRQLREFVETPSGQFVEIFTQQQADDVRASFPKDEPEIEEKRLFRMTPEVIDLLDSFRSRK